MSLLPRDKGIERASLLVRYSMPYLPRAALACLATLLSACCLNVLMADIPPLPPQQALARLAVAHRGSIHDGKPDNSLGAFQQSIGAGVTFLEVDVRLAPDGELFLFHDGSLQRSNYSEPGSLRGRKVQDLSASERASVLLDDSERIPSLSQALDAIRPYPGVSLQLDFKGESDENVFPALDLLRSRKQLHQAVLQIRSLERVPRILSAAPDARLLVRVTSMEQLREAVTYPIEFVELERWASPEAITVAHDARVKVLANLSATCLDTPSRWSYFRSRGIDTIMTDYADKAIR